MDPYDYPLLGYSWRDQLNFDVRLPMGLHSAAMACQRVTKVVCFMLSQSDCDVLSYLDDFMGISAPTTAFKHYALCGSLLDALGLQESSHKACPPSTQITCLGVLFDMVYTVVMKAQFVSVFRDCLACIDVPNPARFRGHSFRRGGATYLLQWHAG